MDSPDLPDLEQLKHTIEEAHAAEDRLLAVDRNAIVLDEGSPGQEAKDVAPEASPDLGDLPDDAGSA